MPFFSHGMWAGSRCWIWARIKKMWPRFWPVLLYFIYLFSRLPCNLPIACLWLKFGKQVWTAPSAFILHSVQAGARCWIWAGSGPESKSVWPRFRPVLVYCIIYFQWLLCSLAMVCLWPKFCKQERTVQVPSFFTVCGSEQGVGTGPELKSMWPRFEPVLHHLVYSKLTLGLPLVYCGPNLANRSGPPKCHHSSQSVGRSKVLDMCHNENQCGTDLGPLYFIWFIHRWHWAFLWPTCGPNLAKRSGPPKCHYSTRPDESVRYGSGPQEFPEKSGILLSVLTIDKKPKMIT